MARYVVRYGVMRMVGVFSSRGDNLRRGSKVIARTNRGMETGEVLCEATEQALAQLVDPTSGQILREMTQEDLNEVEHLRSKERDEFETCERHVEQLKLQMQLVDVEHLFGGERIVVYYLAEERVDFRDLVKSLAGEFQTRIEMRQIGVRDEAKLLADYGDCGKPVCCTTHLIEMPPVSMKMAKLQKATLDPTKISGRCGRLKCCLRYEYDTYEELLKTLPPIGADVVTATGRARILNHEILSQQLLIQTEDNRRMLIPATDVLTVLHTGRGRGPERGDRGGPDRGGPERGEGTDRGESSERSEPSGERRERGGERRPGDRGGNDRGGGDRGAGRSNSRGERGGPPDRGGPDRGGRGERRDRDRGPRREREASQESAPPESSPPVDSAQPLSEVPPQNAPVPEASLPESPRPESPPSATPTAEAMSTVTPPTETPSTVTPPKNEDTGSAATPTPGE